MQSNFGSGQKSSSWPHSLQCASLEEVSKEKLWQKMFKITTMKSVHIM